MNVERILGTLSELGATWGVRLLGVMVALFVAWVIAGWVRRSIRRGLTRARFDGTLTTFFANLARWVVLVGAIIGCLGVFGVETASFAALIAAAGLAIGLSFQGTLGNFASGIMLLVFRPFRVGDVVLVGGFIGTVQEIDLFTTDMTTFDNRKIILPNGAIFGSPIENISHFETRRVDVPVGTDYAANVDDVRAALEKCIADIPGALAEPAPQVFLAALGSSSVDWQMRVWCKTADYWAVHQATIRAAKKALEAARINIPFPQMDVHFDDRALTALQSKPS